MPIFVVTTSERANSHQKSSKRSKTSSKGKVKLNDGQPKAKRRKKSKENGEVKEKPRQRRALNKNEKKRAIDAVEKINLMSTVIIVCAAVKQEVPAHNDALKKLSNSLIPSETVFLIEHLQKMFVEVYQSCSTTKDKYLNFQFKWHHRCGMLLVDTNAQLTHLSLHPSDPLAVEIITVRSKWRKVCSSRLEVKEAFKNYLILFYSSAYDASLQECHSVLHAGDNPSLSVV